MMYGKGDVSVQEYVFCDRNQSATHVYSASEISISTPRPVKVNETRDSKYGGGTILCICGGIHA